jgi:hypothetical protein
MKERSRIFSRMRFRQTPPELPAEQQPEVAEAAGSVSKPPQSMKAAKRLGFKQELEFGLNLKSEGEPSGPTSPQVKVKRRAGRFARVAVDAADGRRPDSEPLS